MKNRPTINHGIQYRNARYDTMYKYIKNYHTFGNTQLEENCGKQCRDWFNVIAEVHSRADNPMAHQNFIKKTALTPAQY